jgi:hypothetical protein
LLCETPEGPYDNANAWSGNVTIQKKTDKDIISYRLLKEDLELTKRFCLEESERFKREEDLELKKRPEDTPLCC